MNYFKNENSLKTPYYSNKISSKNEYFVNLKFFHKILDSLNISLIILIFVLSFLSFSSQREWSTLYNKLAKFRLNNNNLLDYISKTEEFYILEFESLNTLKKTTPKDLIYLDKQMTKKNNSLKKLIKSIQDGFKDSRFQIGY